MVDRFGYSPRQSTSDRHPNMGKKKRGGHDPELELPRWPVKDDKVCVRFSSKNIDPDSICHGTCWYDGVVVEGELHSTDLTVQFRDEVAPYVIDFLGKSKKDWEFFENWETSAKRGPAKKKARQKAALLRPKCHRQHRTIRWCETNSQGWSVAIAHILMKTMKAMA